MTDSLDHLSRLQTVKRQSIFKAHELFFDKDKIYFARVKFSDVVNEDGNKFRYEYSMILNRPCPN